MSRLGPNVRLEQGSAGSVLRYLPQPGSPDIPPLSLHPLLALVLAHLDRGEEKKEIAAALSERLSSPADGIEEVAGDAKICFQRHFQNDNCASFVDLGDLDEFAKSLTPGTVYRARDIVFPGDRALFPLSLQWLVTRFCNRHCIYCYQDAPPSSTAKDAELTGERMREILREAARLGTYNFIVTGGEPLLRDDSYDLLAYALSLGYIPEIISKQRIPAAAAAQLAEAGLKNIYLSIDSLDPAIARKMTGANHFSSEITESVRNLTQARIAVYAKSVLTTENIADVPATLGRLEALGVKWAGLEVYASNVRHPDDLRPSREELLRLRERLEAFKAEGHGITVSFSYDPDASPSNDLGPDCFICPNGTLTLLLLPDGRVARCDKRFIGYEMVVGDLKTQSVREAWSSPEMLKSLKPPRELYAGTICYDCELFDRCDERGRCYYSAYVKTGRYYGPQERCPYINTVTPIADC